MIRVKICGITNLEDALTVAEAGADLMGFVFYPPSPRFVSVHEAREIIAKVREAGFASQMVGVFVNESVDRVQSIVEQCGLDRVQLHGDEQPEWVRIFSPRVYKSLRPRDDSEAERLVETYCSAINGNQPAFIVDSFNPNLFGGTGTRANWTLARTVAEQFPILLAGGMTLDNVEDAIREVQPWGVDVSSGVELAPGLKDHQKVRRFIETVKSVGG